MEDSKVIKEVMSRYDEARENWVRYYGTDEGFDTWFTNKITGGSKYRNIIEVGHRSKMGGA